MVYIRNGICATCALRPVDSRGACPSPTSAPLVIAVARLDPYKSLHVLVQKLLSASDGEFPEHPSGDRRRGKRSGQRLERHDRRPAGLGDVVKLLGARPDVPDLIAACDVATLCSYSETTPLAIMEYMALGKAAGRYEGGWDSRLDRGPECTDSWSSRRTQRRWRRRSPRFLQRSPARPATWADAGASANSRSSRSTRWRGRVEALYQDTAGRARKAPAPCLDHFPAWHPPSALDRRRPRDGRRVTWPTACPLKAPQMRAVWAFGSVEAQGHRHRRRSWCSWS